VAYTVCKSHFLLGTSEPSGQSCSRLVSPAVMPEVWSYPCGSGQWRTVSWRCSGWLWV